MRSILDLNVDELSEILQTNVLPDNVGLQGIEDREDFSRLFKHRASPKYIANTLLKEKAKVSPTSHYVPVESSDVKAERQRNRALELELRQKKVASMTQMQEHLYKKLQAIEDSQMLIISSLSNLRGDLAKLLER